MITSYNTLPLGKYNAIVELLADDTINEHDKSVELLSILDGRTTDELLDLSLPEFAALMEQAAFLNEKQPKGQVADTYKIGIYTLSPIKDIAKMNAGQYIDFQTFASMEDIAGMLSTILVPVGKKYGDGYDAGDVRKAVIDHLSIVDAQALSAFFLKKCESLIRGMLIYSGWQARRLKNKTQRKEIRKRIKEALQRSGDGCHR